VGDEDDTSWYGLEYNNPSRQPIKPLDAPPPGLEYNNPSRQPIKPLDAPPPGLEYNNPSRQPPVRRTSLDAAPPSSSLLLSSGRVGRSKWLRHVRLVLAGGVLIAKSIAIHRTAVLCHCSDGWDRTAQLCATARPPARPHGGGASSVLIG